MKKICCLVLAMLPLTAFAYPIDVEKQLNGLKIDYTTYATDYDMGSITLSNYGDTAADCKVASVRAAITTLAPSSAKRRAAA